jgi:inner membrane protein
MSTVVSELWSKGKLLIKVAVISFIILLLMIPMFQVQQLVSEREDRQKEAINEISSKWAAPQNIKGPVIVIPYWQPLPAVDNKVKSVKHFAYFLPNTINADASIIPIEKHRGIYKVMLYTTRANISGNFQDVNFETLGIAPENMIWNEAFVRLYISDLKGLNEEVVMKWNDSSLKFSPSSPNDPYQNEGLTSPLKLTGINDVQHVNFSVSLNLSGSQQFLISPIAQNTRVNISSSWPNPSFTGDVLPQTSSVKQNGFSASWNFLGLRRNFPQQFTDDQRPLNDLYNLASNSFGVDLFIPVNAYQKTMRSVKYAILCIVLTFAAFFLIEMVNKRSVHPFQYGLIGLALVLFYTLLLSFSEYTGFNIAYVIASIATIALIGWFVKGVLQSGRLSFLLSAIMLLMYTYIFTILQLQDFALILGSIGLFMTLAVIMYFSRKIQW